MLVGLGLILALLQLPTIIATADSLNQTKAKCSYILYLLYVRYIFSVYVRYIFSIYMRWIYKFVSCSISLWVSHGISHRISHGYLTEYLTEYFMEYLNGISHGYLMEYLTEYLTEYQNGISLGSGLFSSWNLYMYIYVMGFLYDRGVVEVGNVMSILR